MVACFLPIQQHKAGLRGGCVQAINSCRRRRLLLCTDKGRVRAGAGSWNQAGHTQTRGSIYLGLQDGWFSPGALYSCSIFSRMLDTQGKGSRGCSGLCSLGFGQDSFGKSLLHTFWVPFSLISEHWSQDPKI